MFNKISKFESPTITNDFIMTLLPKTIAKFGPSRNQTNYIYNSKGTDESYPKMYFLLNLNHYVKSYGHFLSNFGLFYDARSCHVTQKANFENFLFCPNSIHILGKVTKFLVKKLSTSEVISQKPHGGWGVGKQPPVPLGLRDRKQGPQRITVKSSEVE